MKLRFSLSAMGILLWFATSTFGGEQARSEVKVSPAVKLSAKTDGESEARVAINVLTSISDSIDLLLSPSFSAGIKDGSALLVQKRNEDDFVPGTKWAGGLSLSLVGLHNLAEQTENLKKLKLRAQQKCSEVCKANENADGCKSFAEVVSSPALSIDRSEFCLAGQKILENLDSSGGGKFPLHVESLASEIGQGSFGYLSAGTNDKYALSREYLTDWRMAASSVYLLGYQQSNNRFPLEIAAQYAYTYEESQVIGKWCFPSGEVQKGELDSTIQTCNESPIGKPSNRHQTSLVLQIGYIDSVQGNWRISIGPTYTYSKSKSTTGFQTPLWFTLANLPGFADDFKGIIRLTPQVNWQSSNGTNDRSVQLLLDLFLDKSIFPKSLDYFD